MNATKAVMEARTAGIQLDVEGDDLVLEASAPPPPAMLDLLSRHKAAIVLLLRPGVDSWAVEDWKALFDERAGIAEFDGGLPRAQAETLAYACCAAEWLNRHSVRSPPGQCLDCGGRDHAHDPLLPYGVEPTGHAWLHSYCWPTWYEARKAKAVAALAAMGITVPVGQSIKQEEQSEHLPSDAARELRAEETNLPFTGK